MQNIFNNYEPKLAEYKNTNIAQNQNLSLEFKIIKAQIIEAQYPVYTIFPFKSRFPFHEWSIIKDRFEFFHIMLLHIRKNQTEVFQKIFFPIERNLELVSESLEMDNTTLKVIRYYDNSGC